MCVYIFICCCCILRWIWIVQLRYIFYPASAHAPTDVSHSYEWDGKHQQRPPIIVYSNNNKKKLIWIVIWCCCCSPVLLLLLLFLLISCTYLSLCTMLWCYIVWDVCFFYHLFHISALCDANTVFFSSIQQTE